MKTLDTYVGRWTGIALWSMALLAGGTYGLGMATLWLPDDAQGTGVQVLAHPATLYGSIVGWILIALLDLAVSIGLWRYLGRRIWSTLAMLARLVYTLFLLVAIGALLRIVPLMDTGLSANAADIPLRIGMAMGTFFSIWEWGLGVFGGHLILVAVAAWHTSHLPRWMAILLAIAGSLYLWSAVAQAQGNAPWSDAVAPWLETVMAIGELALATWLMVWGDARRATAFAASADSATRA